MPHKSQLTTKNYTLRFTSVDKDRNRASKNERLGTHLDWSLLLNTEELDKVFFVPPIFYASHIPI